jgi:hypothetical protein
MQVGQESKSVVVDGKLVAVSLGADFAAEHEWGIQDIRRAFNMNPNGLGLARTQITHCSRFLQYCTAEYEYQKEKYAFEALLLGRDDNHIPYIEEPWKFKADGWYGAWNERSFMLAARSEEKKEQLRDLYKSFQSLDVCIWLGGGQFLENPGLTFGIVSRMPKEIFETWETADKAKHLLKEKAAATGIEARLKAAGKKWFALSPRNEQGQLKFLLNPMDQINDNWGFYTVQELDQWIEGKGPVVKGKK